MCVRTCLNGHLTGADTSFFIASSLQYHVVIGFARSNQNMLNDIQRGCILKLRAGERRSCLLAPIAICACQQHEKQSGLRSGFRCKTL